MLFEDLLKLPSPARQHLENRPMINPVETTLVLSVLFQVFPDDLANGNRGLLDP